MYSYTINTAAASNPQAARIDAAQRNLRNQPLWSVWQRLRAEAMLLELQMIYRAEGFYISYGVRGVSVKVDRVHAIADRKLLRSVERHWDSAGVRRKFTPQGVIYRFC